MTHPLSGKHYWLIGASAGIGEALAQKMADCGAKLTLSARSEQPLQDLKTTLSGAGHRVLPLDVTDEAAVKAAANSADYDGILYLAGIYDPMSSKEMDVAKTLKTVDVNLNGAVRVIGHSLPQFLAKNAGHFVITASVAGYRGLPKAMGYGLSKAALIHMGENLRVDLSDTGIKVQIICPGFVKTRLTEKNDFPMPAAITAEKAADYIVKGLQSNAFEIHFPKRFTLFLKFLQLLPYRLYFALISKI